MNLIIEYPTWTIGACLVVGLLVAAILYRRDRLNRHYSQGLRGFLGILRWASFSLLAFFLLKPLLKSVDRELEKPIIVFAQDNSSSLVFGADSTSLKNNYSTEINAFLESFGDDFEVRSYTFGDDLKEGLEDLDFSEQSTNFSLVLDEIYNKFSNRNLGAVVLASDGLYNQGMNPLYSFRKLNVPIYTLALGDTTFKRDAMIREVQHNRLAYLGNKFPLRIFADFQKCQGESTQLTVSRDGVVLHKEILNPALENEQFERTVLLDADQPGLKRYRVSISSLDNEYTLQNNSRNIFIDVLDSKQKILLLSNSPHPDIAALSQSIESNENYDVQEFQVDDFDGNILDYNLVVYHQLPNVSNQSVELIQEALDNNIPGLFIVGSQTRFDKLNDLNLGFVFTNFNGQLNESNASYQDGFSLFKLSENTEKMIRKMPPLHIPFGDNQTAAGVQRMINQRIGNIQTQKSLIGFNNRNDVRIGLISGEGIWRWKTAAYLEYDNHDSFNELSTKIVQYLASKDDKRYFRVDSKSDFKENEELVFNAELYNDSYENINSEEVSMVITNESEEEFSYEFSKTDSNYRLQVSALPVGNYTYTAQVTRNGRILTEAGEFSISPIFLEELSNRADYQLLNSFAQENGGEMVERNELGRLATLISANDQVHSVSYETKVLNDLIREKWLLLVLLLLLSTEWLLRKRNGTY